MKKMPFSVLLSFLLLFNYCKKDKEELLPSSEKIFNEPVPQGSALIKSDKQNFWLDTVAVDLGKPWGMAFLPGGEFLISDREGRLLLIDPIGNSRVELSGLPELYIGGQGGLLDIKLHPEYKTNGWIYLSYSKRQDQGFTTAISRCRISGTRLTDMQELFVAQPSYSTSHHFGCRMNLHQGYLFFSVGDRGQMKDAQKLTTHNGKVMRIVDDGSIPEDNPFVTIPGSKKEIWAYGHRNPQGMDRHPISGKLYTHEHGPKGGDELNLEKRGANYGWPEITFGIDYDGSIISNDTAKEGMEAPLTYWVPSIAPCGMVIYSGNKYPGWHGDYFIGGLVSRTLFRVELLGDNYRRQERLLEKLGRVRNVAQSPDGYLYVATENPGVLYRLAPAQ
ncbi:MAG: PQQ-dependent sugar dehydrogenase [Vicingaceae bacterium]